MLMVLRQLGNGGDSLPGETINRSMLKTYCEGFVSRTDCTVELYEGTGSKWELVKSGTSGKVGFFEDVLFAGNEMQETPVVMAVSVTIPENERCVACVCGYDKEVTRHRTRSRAHSQRSS